MHVNFPPECIHRIQSSSFAYLSKTRSCKSGREKNYQSKTFFLCTRFQFLTEKQKRKTLIIISKYIGCVTRERKFELKDKVVMMLNVNNVDRRKFSCVYGAKGEKFLLD